LGTQLTLEIKNVSEVDHLRLTQMIGLVNTAKFGDQGAKQMVEAAEALKWFKDLAGQMQAVRDLEAPKVPEKKEPPKGDAPPSAAGDTGPLNIKNYNPGKPPTAKQRRGK
jgi:hypothetical protein